MSHSSEESNKVKSGSVSFSEEALNKFRQQKECSEKKKGKLSRKNTEKYDLNNSIKELDLYLEKISLYAGECHSYTGLNDAIEDNNSTNLHEQRDNSLHTTTSSSFSSSLPLPQKNVLNLDVEGHPAEQFTEKIHQCNNNDFHNDQPLPFIYTSRREEKNSLNEPLPQDQALASFSPSSSYTEDEEMLRLEAPKRRASRHSSFPQSVGEHEQVIDSKLRQRSEEFLSFHSNESVDEDDQILGLSFYQQNVEQLPSSHKRTSVDEEDEQSLGSILLKDRTRKHQESTNQNSKFSEEHDQTRGSAYNISNKQPVTNTRPASASSSSSFPPPSDDEDEILSFTLKKNKNSTLPTFPSDNLTINRVLGSKNTIPKSILANLEPHLPNSFTIPNITCHKNTKIDKYPRKPLPRSSSSAKRRDPHLRPEFPKSKSIPETITIDILKKVPTKPCPKWLLDAKKQVTHHTRSPSLASESDDNDDEPLAGRLERISKKKFNLPNYPTSRTPPYLHEHPKNNPKTDLLTNKTSNYVTKVVAINKVKSLKKPTTQHNNSSSYHVANLTVPPKTFLKSMKLHRKVTARIFIESPATHVDLTLYPNQPCADVISQISSLVALDTSTDHALFEINKTLLVERPIFEWESVLNCVLNWSNNKYESYSLLLKPYPYTKILKPSQAIGKFLTKEGYLYKEVSSKRWKRKYLVLKKGMVYIFPNESSTTPEFTIDLSNRHVFTSINYSLEKTTGRIVFSLISQTPISSFCNASERILNFDATDENNFFSWVTAIRIAEAKNTFISNPSIFINSRDAQVKSRAQLLISALKEDTANKEAPFHSS